MSSYISAAYRRTVLKRSASICEYCLIHEEDAFFSFEIDHIISEKHNGITHPDNLAHTCFYCNRYKGSDIGSILIPDSEFIRFYNPRTDIWSQHFRLEGALIIPQTKIGEVTVKIFQFNHVDRLIERKLLIELGRYPGIISNA